MILLVVKKSSKSQVQEDFHCNEDALFNVFFWLSFGVCLPGVMSLRGKLCYFHVSLVARGCKLLFIFYINVPKINKVYLWHLSSHHLITLCSLTFASPWRLDHTVLSFERVTYAIIMWQSPFLPAPNPLLRWMESPHYRVVPLASSSSSSSSSSIRLGHIMELAGVVGGGRGAGRVVVYV